MISTQTVTVTTPSPNVACTSYGYGFDTLATFTVTRHFIDFYDGTDNLVKEIRHVDFTGTLYRSDDLSKTVPYAGNWTRTMDVAANRVTSTGLFRYSHPDGSGMVALDAGRTVQDGRTFDTLSDTGPTQTEWQKAGLRVPRSRVAPNSAGEGASRSPSPAGSRQWRGPRASRVRLVRAL